MATFKGYPLALTNSQMRSTLSWDLEPVKEISISDGTCVIFRDREASGMFQVNPRVNTTYTLTATIQAPTEKFTNYSEWEKRIGALLFKIQPDGENFKAYHKEELVGRYDLENNKGWISFIYQQDLPPVTIQISPEMGAQLMSTHIFDTERESQFEIIGENLLKIGVPQILGDTKKPVGINGYAFNKCTERYPEVNNPLDSSQFYPGMRDIRIPLYRFDSGILLDFDIDSPMSAFAPAAVTEMYAIETNSTGQPKSLGFRLSGNPAYRQVSSYYYQSILDNENSLVTNETILNPDGTHRNWTAYRLHSTFTINPRNGKVLVPEGDTELVDTEAENPSFWMAAGAHQKLELSGKEDRSANYDNRLHYTYSFDFDEYSGYRCLDFWIAQDHWTLHLYSDQSVVVIKNDTLLGKTLYPAGGWDLTQTEHVYEVSSEFLNPVDLYLYLDPDTKEIYNDAKSLVLGNWFYKRNLEKSDQTAFANWVGFSSFATQSRLETWEASLKNQIFSLNKQIREGEDTEGNPLTPEQIQVLRDSLITPINTLKGLRRETLADLQFPERDSLWEKDFTGAATPHTRGIFQSLPGSLRWNGSEDLSLNQYRDPDTNEIISTTSQIHLNFGYPDYLPNTSYIDVPVSNDRVLTSLSFDEHRPLPILAMGCVTIISECEAVASEQPLIQPEYILPDLLNTGVAGAFFYITAD